MLNSRSKKRPLAIVTLALLSVWLCFTPETRAQGSVYGEVSLSDLSAPGDSDLVFFGFIRGTDEAIRLSTADGAGYEIGFWFDDFQNYLDEAPDVRFDYFFFDTAAMERCHLSGTILSESIQQEDAALSVVSFPSAPTSLSSTRSTAEKITLHWDSDPGLTYHVYRRTQPSNGLMFRVDDPDGHLTNAGVSGSTFEDTTAQAGFAYDYILIAQAGTAQFSPPSVVLEVSDEYGCCLPPTVGDVNQSGEVDITDLQVMVDHQFLTLIPLVCDAEGDLDLSGEVNITDLQILIDNQFLTLTPLPPCP